MNDDGVKIAFIVMVGTIVISYFSLIKKCIK